MAGQFQVVSQALRSSALASRQIGDELTTTAGQFGDTDAVIAAHGGFAAAAALQECLTVWAGRMRTDSADLSAAGDALDQSGVGYDSTDTAGAARLAKVSRQLPL